MSVDGGAIVERLPWDLWSRLFRWHHPSFKVRLGRTRFASLSDTPDYLSSWIGARSFQYEEVHYYGNPGNYLNYVFAVTDSGPMVADAIGDLFYPDGPHAGEITWNAPVGAVLDDDVPGIGAFRYRARMNSIAFVSWEPDDVKSVLLFVRRDEVRTFA